MNSNNMSSSNKLYLPVDEMYFAHLEFLRKDLDIGSISFIEACVTKNLTSSTVRR